MKQIIYIITLAATMVSCNVGSTKTEVVKVDGNEIQVQDSENLLSSDYRLNDLSEKQIAEFKGNLSKAQTFIETYSENKDWNNSENLDEVLERWKADNSKTKVTKNEVVQMLGSAFGQHLINTLECEWQILTDKYGTDFTVIHKQYKVNAFPFSSVLKAIDQDRKGSLNDIKLILKKNILEAQIQSNVKER